MVQIITYIGGKQYVGYASGETRTHVAYSFKFFKIRDTKTGAVIG